MLEGSDYVKGIRHTREKEEEVNTVAFSVE
jgi:hypothetical protein